MQVTHKTALPYLLILLVSCGTFRAVNDDKTERLTGVRTMHSNSGWTAADSLESAISAAKKECEQEKKSYQYVDHHIANAADLRYKCL